ncbi:NADH:ubiquinone oxidoreductase subunit NDUFA12 [Elioraea tepida]|jgi:NADH:ubiquinone oxidoreductase subunit|uniref:NADH:ubiquinone oxidoreductase subunit NDUFA12 n=1 Tax=Elioraea tepida TaxID=2843330 RepID=A0A975U530_9PROT|nr:NADH:ubiquinone oxidoreductase subunit NDUFA12 [Elioraea tepida]QXM25714.1 NADH:ubiquinone oxidoreductase subunit NDUFA12 [Elioraea tepida]
MTIGTRLFTRLRGREVGRDRFGNVYYEERRPRPGMRRRRWVIYARNVDASEVPPEWHAWLHYTTDAPLPEVKLYPWQKEHQPNLTGTPLAYRPPGHDLEGGRRQRATGDYEAWTPEAEAGPEAEGASPRR